MKFALLPIAFHRAMFLCLLLCCVSILQLSYRVCGRFCQCHSLCVSLTTCNCRNSNHYKFFEHIKTIMMKILLGLLGYDLPPLCSSFWMRHQCGHVSICLLCVCVCGQAHNQSVYFVTSSYNAILGCVCVCVCTLRHRWSLWLSTAGLHFNKWKIPVHTLSLTHTITKLPLWSGQPLVQMKYMAKAIMAFLMVIWSFACMCVSVYMCSMCTSTVQHRFARSYVVRTIRRCVFWFRQLN